ncbi:MAG: adenylosuccinate synthase [Candidatus Cloacimonetes bacterium]|nr:adenylosuccinate synthase [Candidatus Cloacimonadota bacterium]
MASILVMGCMWGDEAKAKIVDYLAGEARFVVRFQGGSNAGHTIVHQGKKYVFHTVPSGIMYPEVKCLIGMGVVIEPQALLNEIADLEKQGLKVEGRLMIDYRAGLVLPLHKELDSGHEENLGKAFIGTTHRGIGPAYSDLTARVAIRWEDLAHPGYLKERLEALYRYHHRDITAADIKSQIAELRRCYKLLHKYTGNVEQELHAAYYEDANILFEGAQGSLLDLGFGSYPYVTSSRVMTDGVGIGTGFSSRYLDKVIGVYKAYGTRVGEGPMPTELKNKTGEQIRKTGNEYGATTGRPRRIGWFDAVAGAQTARINALDSFALTCLDVLSGIVELKICTAYSYKNVSGKNFISHPLELKQVKPIYESFKGWEEDLGKCKNLKKLPKAARDYLKALEELLNIPLEIVSVGRERSQTFMISR